MHPISARKVGAQTRHQQIQYLLPGYHVVSLETIVVL